MTPRLSTSARFSLLYRNEAVKCAQLNLNTGELWLPQSAYIEGVTKGYSCRWSE